MFVSDSAMGVVSVISDSANTVVANVTVGFQPRGVACMTRPRERYS